MILIYQSPNIVFYIKLIKPISQLGIWGYFSSITIFIYTVWECVYFW